MDSSNFSKRLLKDDTEDAETISLGNYYEHDTCLIYCIVYTVSKS